MSFGRQGRGKTQSTSAEHLKPPRPCLSPMNSPLAKHYGLVFKPGCYLVVAAFGTTMKAQIEARREFEAMPQIHNVRQSGHTTSRDREGFAFYYAHGITVKEIATKFGVSQMTVGKHLNRKFPR